MYFGFTLPGGFKKLAGTAAIAAVAFALMLQPCLPLLAVAQGDLAAQGQSSGAGNNIGADAGDYVAYQSGNSGSSGGEMVCCPTLECGDGQMTRIVLPSRNLRFLAVVPLVAIPSLDSAPGYSLPILAQPDFFHPAIFPTTSLPIQIRSLLI